MLALPIKKEFVVLPDTPISEAIAQVTAATWTSDLRQQRSAAAAGIICESWNECEGFPDISAKAWLILLYAFTCIRGEALRFGEAPSRKVHIQRPGFLALLGDDIDNAARGIAAVKGRSRTFHNLDAFHIVHVQSEPERKRISG